MFPNSVCVLCLSLHMPTLHHCDFYEKTIYMYQYNYSMIYKSILAYVSHQRSICIVL